MNAMLEYWRTIDELRDQVARQRELILSLAEKLYIVAMHLGKLSERMEKRGKP